MIEGYRLFRKNRLGRGEGCLEMDEELPEFMGHDKREERDR